MSRITLKNTPELIVLLQQGETLSVFTKLPPEQILLRWVNYHLAKSKRTVRALSNFASDVTVSVLVVLVPY